MTRPDDGAANPVLALALRQWQADPAPAARARVLAALPGARLFVGVTATATGREPTGLRAESGADLSVVSVVAPDGRRALVALSSLAELARWEPTLRPVALTAPRLCAGALSDGAEAVLLDPAGAHLTLSGTELAELAAGRVPVAGAPLSLHTGRLTEPHDRPPASFLASLARALAGEQVVSARVLDGPTGLVLGVVPRRSLEAAGLAALAQRLARRLGQDLPTGGLDLAVVGTDGPGVPVPLRRGLGRRIRPGG